MIRKKGKLPGKTLCTAYKLEYGRNQLEIQKDMLNKKDKVVIIDDIFATSGTILASIKHVNKIKAKTQGVIVLLELAFLNGRSKMKDKLVSLYRANI
jgi:adenine phosphoribosyltransferase